MFLTLWTLNENGGGAGFIKCLTPRNVTNARCTLLLLLLLPLLLLLLLLILLMLLLLLLLLISSLLFTAQGRLAREVLQAHYRGTLLTTRRTPPHATVQGYLTYKKTHPPRTLP